MSQVVGAKAFLLPGMRDFATHGDRSLFARPEINDQPKSRLSRRDWLKTAGIGAAGLLAVGLLPRRSDAFLLHIAGGLACAILGLAGAILHVAAVPVIAAIHAAKWVIRAPFALAHHFHYRYCSPWVPDQVIQPVQSDIYPGTYFEMNSYGRIGSNSQFQAHQDLNTPEALRVRHEMPATGPYRMVSGQYSMRRPLTSRDRDLFYATLDNYRQTGYVPDVNSITPVYAREMATPESVLHTGFGLTTRDGGKNFLLANVSSWM